MKKINSIISILHTHSAFTVILFSVLFSSENLRGQTYNISKDKSKAPDKVLNHGQVFAKGRYVIITPQPTDSNVTDTKFDATRLLLAEPADSLSLTTFFEGHSFAKRKIVLRPGLLLSSSGSNFAAALSFPEGVLELRNVGGNIIKLKGGTFDYLTVTMSCNVAGGKQYMATLDLDNRSSSSRSYILAYRQGNDTYHIVGKISGRGQLPFLINMPANLDHNSIYTEFYLCSFESGTYFLNSFTLQEL